MVAPPNLQPNCHLGWPPLALLRENRVPTNWKSWKSISCRLLCVTCHTVEGNLHGFSWGTFWCSSPSLWPWALGVNHCRSHVTNKQETSWKGCMIKSLKPQRIIYVLFGTGNHCANGRFGFSRSFQPEFSKASWIPVVAAPTTSPVSHLHPLKSHGPSAPWPTATAKSGVAPPPLGSDWSDACFLPLQHGNHVLGGSIWTCSCASHVSGDLGSAHGQVATVHKKNHSQIRAPRHKVNCVFFSFPVAAVSAMANVNLCAAACHSTSSQRRALHDHRVQLGVPVSVQGTTCFSVKRMWAFARNDCRVIPFALLLPVRFFWGDTFPNAIRRRTTRRRKKHQLCLQMAPSFFMWMFAAWHAWCF